MNIEQVCEDAIAVVERYLANDLAAADMYDELQEALNAVEAAWHHANSHRSSLRKATRLCRLCRAAWLACLAAKNDERVIAKVSVNEFWDRV